MAGTRQQPPIHDMLDTRHVCVEKRDYALKNVCPGGCSEVFEKYRPSTLEFAQGRFVNKKNSFAHWGDCERITIVYVSILEGEFKPWFTQHRAPPATSMKDKNWGHFHARLAMVYLNMTSFLANKSNLVE